MKHILITRSGKVMLFYIAGLAQMYQAIHGGVVVEEDEREVVDKALVE